MDDELLKILRVPRSMLPEVKDSSAKFGDSIPSLFAARSRSRELPATSRPDHRASLLHAGMIKSTYGTGCFALLNTGATPVVSRNKLLTTIANQLGGNAPMRWKARSSLRARRCNAARRARPHQRGRRDRTARRQVRLHAERLSGPAFVAWGALLESQVRGALFGLTRNTGPAELAHATLESVCYQTFISGPDARRLPRRKPPHRAPRRRRHDRLRTGPCSASPICWTRRSTPDDPGETPRSAPPISPGGGRRLSRAAKFADNWRLEHRFKRR